MKVKSEMKSLSGVRLLATPWTVAHQAPPSMGFPGKSTGVGCHCLLRSQDYLGSLKSSVVLFKFKDFFLCEKCHWNFDRDCIESPDCSGQYEHLLLLPVHEHGISSSYLCLEFPSSVFYGFQDSDLLPPWLVNTFCL